MTDRSGEREKGRLRRGGGGTLGMGGGKRAGEGSTGSENTRAHTPDPDVGYPSVLDPGHPHRVGSQRGRRRCESLQGNKTAPGCGEREELHSGQS